MACKLKQHSVKSDQPYKEERTRQWYTSPHSMVKVKDLVSQFEVDGSEPKTFRRKVIINPRGKVDSFIPKSAEKDLHTKFASPTEPKELKKLTNSNFERLVSAKKEKVKEHAVKNDVQEFMKRAIEAREEQFESVLASLERMKRGEFAAVKSLSNKETQNKVDDIANNEKRKSDLFEASSGKINKLKLEDAISIQKLRELENLQNFKSNGSVDCLLETSSPALEENERSDQKSDGIQTSAQTPVQIPIQTAVHVPTGTSLESLEKCPLKPPCQVSIDESEIYYDSQAHSSTVDPLPELDEPFDETLPLFIMKNDRRSSGESSIRSLSLPMSNLKQKNPNLQVTTPATEYFSDAGREELSCAEVPKMKEIKPPSEFSKEKVVDNTSKYTFGLDLKEGTIPPRSSRRLSSNSKHLHSDSNLNSIDKFSCQKNSMRDSITDSARNFSLSTPKREVAKSQGMPKLKAQKLRESSPGIVQPGSFRLGSPTMKAFSKSASSSIVPSPDLLRVTQKQNEVNLTTAGPESEINDGGMEGKTNAKLDQHIESFILDRGQRNEIDQKDEADMSVDVRVLLNKQNESHLNIGKVETNLIKNSDKVVLKSESLEKVHRFIIPSLPSGSQEQLIKFYHTKSGQYKNPISTADRSTPEFIQAESSRKYSSSATTGSTTWNPNASMEMARKSLGDKDQHSSGFITPDAHSGRYPTFRHPYNQMAQTSEEVPKGSNFDSSIIGSGVSQPNRQVHSEKKETNHEHKDTPDINNKYIFNIGGSREDVSDAGDKNRTRRFSFRLKLLFARRSQKSSKKDSRDNAREAGKASVPTEIDLPLTLPPLIARPAVVALSTSAPPLTSMDESYHEYIEQLKRDGRAISPRGFLLYLASNQDGSEWDEYLHTFANYIESRFAMATSI